MTPEFDQWWNEDKLLPDNPYREDTPAFWAWEGWVAGQKVERKACADLCERWAIEAPHELERNTGNVLYEGIMARGDA